MKYIEHVQQSIRRIYPSERRLCGQQGAVTSGYTVDSCGASATIGDPPLGVESPRTGLGRRGDALNRAQLLDLRGTS